VGLAQYDLVDTHLAVIDVDGIIYQYVHELAKVAAYVLDRPVERFVSATRWDFFLDWGLTLEDYLELVEVGVAEYGFLARGEPYANSVEGWRKLREAGVRIHLATHCPGRSAQEARVAWLTGWGFDYDEIDFGEDKSSVARAGLDAGLVVWALEDAPKNYLALVGAGARCYLRDHPYNQDILADRVLDVDDFANRVLDGMS